MSDEATSTPGGDQPPPPPPEVEQAVLLGHIEEAISLYVRHTDVDPEVARRVVEELATE
jgi:hypothetical protein